MMGGGSVTWIKPEVLNDFECNPSEDFNEKAPVVDPNYDEDKDP